MQNSDKYSLLQFKAGYDLLMVHNKHLRLENDQLKKEMIVLKDKLGINSSNSSMPPSSDFKKPKKERSLPAEAVEDKLVIKEVPELYSI